MRAVGRQVKPADDTAWLNLLHVPIYLRVSWNMIGLNFDLGLLTSAKTCFIDNHGDAFMERRDDLGVIY